MSGRRWIGPVSLALLVAGVWALKAANPFQWDDFHFIFRDRFVQNPAHLLAFFHTDAAGLYRPLRSVVYLLLFLLPGDGPLAYHLAGIAFHLATTLAVYGIVRRLFARADVGWWTAAVFGVHPLATGRIANITGSLDAPGVMLALVSFWLLLVGIERAGRATGVRVASILGYVAALFYSEEAAVIAPVILAYGLIYRPGGIERRWAGALVLALPYLAAVCAYALVRTAVLGQVGRVAAGTPEHLAALAVTPAIFFRYLVRLFFPLYLSPAYGVTPSAIGAPSAFLAGAVLALLIALAVVVGRRHKEIGFVFVWLAAALAPFANLLPTGELMADRYCYHATAPFWAAVIGGLSIAVGLRRPAVRVLLSAVVVCFLLLTVHRIALWSSPLSLWADAAASTPRSYAARVNYGIELRHAGRDGEALAEFDEAAALDPGRPLAYVNRAQIRLEEGKTVDAARDFTRALYADPENVQAPAGMANILILAGRLDDAAELARRAESIDPTRDSVHNALAFIAYKQGRIDEAVRRYELVATTSLDPALVAGARRALEAIRSEQSEPR